VCKKTPFLWLAVLNENALNKFSRQLTNRDRRYNVVAHSTLFVFSQWMNSRTSLDSGRIWVLGYDQVEQQLQCFIFGKRAVILIVGIIGCFNLTDFLIRS